MVEDNLFSDHVVAMRAQWCAPVDLGTADCGKICRGEDGCDYVIKEMSAHPAVPHSEWFCSQLGEKIGIAAPPHKVIDMRDGTMAFGSRWQGGVLSPDPEKETPWYVKVKAGEIALADASKTLSRIYALDQFVHNVDRHCTNFLIHPQFNGHAILALDYSRAWVRFGFPLALPPLPDCNTVNAQRWLTNYWGEKYVNPAAVRDTCDAISRISVDVIIRIIQEHPENWLPETTRSAIIAWWGSDDMSLRLNMIAEGVENGNCL